jgi:hypothetical protein
MSGREPITTELRAKLAEYEPQETDDAFVTRPVGRTGYDAIVYICDSIDAVHENLERENAKLRELVQYIYDECYGDDWFAEQAAELGFEPNY